jgi:CCR4-NOT transcription complex subunit 1
LYGASFQVQDKVSFMINNLMRDNLEAKAEELKKALKPEMWPWFCNYMVIRRVAQEANHQNLYLQVPRLARLSSPCQGWAPG